MDAFGLSRPTFIYSTCLPVSVYSVPIPLPASERCDPDLFLSSWSLLSIGRGRSIWDGTWFGATLISTCFILRSAVPLPPPPPPPPVCMCNSGAASLMMADCFSVVVSDILGLEFDIQGWSPVMAACLWCTSFENLCADCTLRRSHLSLALV